MELIVLRSCSNHWILFFSKTANIFIERVKLFKNIYHVLKGEVLKVEEHTLDLKQILNLPYKPDDVRFIIARFLRRRLIKALPELHAMAALKKFTALGRQKYFTEDIETDENFMHSNKRKVEINDNLEILMRKGVETITKDTVFGEEDLLDNKCKYQTTAIAKTPCWILRVKQNVFKTELKETVRRIKEAKSIFLFYSMPFKSKNFNYLRLKKFFMKDFKEEKVKIHENIITQDQPSEYLYVIKQGSFELSKKVKLKVGYDGLENKKEKEIVLLVTPGSIVGEDGYLYNSPNSYSVSST